ncbi:uncharacterized protein SAPINGB_P000676 [Magnusiomyces paraingens]|uniref:Peroxin/Ferlin domain-containing protein n=1 Tax=Magnusiomyces paraingens TaxID=2606893 RepID=A0A5E8B2T4_9ASCO|nr:uncharacterized protein SAPINGB_P000676 [Saprochaete ingens]VVT45216.1 unnamed protein product [Saprochaete ingens]
MSSPPKQSAPAPAEKRTEVPTYAAFAPSTALPPQNTSPLLASTPPTITKALSQAYPLLLAADHAFALLTWTCDDLWQPFLLTVTYAGLVLYSDPLLKYAGHLFAVAAVAAHVYAGISLAKERASHPTLDSIVHTLTNLTTRANLFFSPITTLNLSPHDVSRLLFTTLFMSPVYMIIAFFVLTPRSIILFTGIAILTYHSVYARVTRAVLWRSRSIRLAAFYITGLDFSRTLKRATTGSSSAAAAAAAATAGSPFGVQSKDGKPVRFVYVIYENQRRWLGIGWTANLLAYERAPWTDEFLNESPAPEAFRLPSDDEAISAVTGVTASAGILGGGNNTNNNTSSSTAVHSPSSSSSSSSSTTTTTTTTATTTTTSAENNNNNNNSNPFGSVHWRWVDKTWKLDQTNDGALVVPKGKSRLTADPGSANGWVYYDNTWKKPSTEDTFLKYTRRRRWVRTAELVSSDHAAATPILPAAPPPAVTAQKSTASAAAATATATAEPKSEPKQRKSIRFEE